MGRTIFWTIVCGCGHVWSSVLLGLGGAALGWSISKVRWLENVRGGVQVGAMLGFGLVYGAWGLLRARQNRRHKHFDVYEDGSVYVYDHRHGETVRPRDRHAVTPWVLFIVFALGPCEPMIPLLFFPAAKASWLGMALLIAVYTVCTLATMVGMVISGYYGLRFVRTEKLERISMPWAVSPCLSAARAWFLWVGSIILSFSSESFSGQTFPLRTRYIRSMKIYLFFLLLSLFGIQALAQPELEPWGNLTGFAWTASSWSSNPVCVLSARTE